MKFINAIVLFLTLCITYSLAYTVDITLEKAKELKVNTCNKDEDCKKEYETTCYKPDEKKDGYCISKLFCRTGEKCIYEINNEEQSLVVNYQNVSTGNSFFSLTTPPKLIIESCNEKLAKNGKCYTRECSKAEDCSSGRCENGVCILNDKPLYICTNDSTQFPSVKEGDDFSREKLTCKLVEQESCSKVTNCANHACNKIDGQKICALKPEGSGSSWFSKLIKIVLEFIGIVVVGSLVFCGVKRFFNKRSHGRVKKDLKVKYEMEEAFLKDNTKNYVELEDIDEYDFEQVRKYGNKL